MNVICLVLGFVLGGITGAFISFLVDRIKRPWKYGPENMWEYDDTEWEDDHFDSLKNRGRDDPRENR